jgi:hypothetical protein
MEKIMNTASHPFDQFAERLDKLERRNRRLTSVLVLLLVAGGLVLLGAAQKAERQSSEMESFVLRDSAGKERARLAIGKEGPALQFRKPESHSNKTVSPSLTTIATPRPVGQWAIIVVCLVAITALGTGKSVFLRISLRPAPNHVIRCL